MNENFIKWWIIGVGIISLILILLSLALPSVGTGLVKGPIAQTTSSYRQLWILTQSASLDSQTAGGKGTFPGDLNNSFTAWSNSLVPSYCNKTNFQSHLMVEGKLTNTTIYAVKNSDDPATVFFSTANIDSTGLHDRPPYGLRGGAVVTVGGNCINFNNTTNSAFINLIWPKQTVKP